MKFVKLKLYIFTFLALASMITQANDAFDQQRPDGVEDKKWSGLKMAVQEAKLLPEPAGLGGEDSNFGYSVSVDGNRALVGAPNMAGAGAAVLLEFDGMNWQKVAVLQPSDGAASDVFGISVSLSGDRALVGAPFDDDNGSDSGSAYIYDYDGMNWNQTTKLIAADGTVFDEFGYSVSLSGDRALVGAFRDDDNGSASGSAYIYDYDGMNWNQTAKLKAGDGAPVDWFGRSVSLSGDRALVSAPLDDDNARNTGSAYIYDYDGMNWNQTAKLRAADGAKDDKFGISVSLSGDRVLVGAYLDDVNVNGSDSGSAYIFDYAGMNWNQTAKLRAGDGAASDEFGYSVSLSGDRALVGAYADDDNGSSSGSAYIYDYNGVSWNQSAKLIAGDGAADDEFGISVSLSGDRALVGAYLDDDNGSDSGSSYFYDYASMNWNLTAKLSAGDGAANDYFGYSVSLSGDRALVGAYRDDDNGSDSGSAYIYDYDGMNWNLAAKLIAGDGAVNDNFGYSVSLSGNRALVGAHRDDDNGSNSGSAYIYDYNGMNWSQTAKLSAGDGSANDEFGFSVSLSGDRALVGAFKDDDNGNASGSAYIYDYASMNWNQTAKLSAGDGAANDQFGFSVSLSGDRALVGAYLDDDKGSDSGSAYIYDYDGMNWSQDAKLIAGDGKAYDNFGYSVSLSGGRALVGAYRDDDIGVNSGSAYIYDYDGMNWNLAAKLIAGDGRSSDNFGISVSLSGDRVLVGAYGDDDNGSNSGSAYVYDYDGMNWSQTAKLSAGDGRADDQFGISVSLSGNRALVGAYGDDDHGTVSGSAYIINSPPQFNVNVTVTGLAATNSISFANGGDTAIFTTNETQTISILDDGSTFNVAFDSAQPDTPNQVCSFSNANSGSLNGGDIEVTVECVTTQYDVNITVTGLAATNFISFSNGGDMLIFGVNQTKTISTLDDGAGFNVSIDSLQPDTPDQVCSFTNANSGSLNGADVEVTVECVTTQYEVNVTVTGLAATNSISFSNGADTATFTTNETQTISTLDDGTGFNVSIDSLQPDTPDQVCSFTNTNSGNLNGGDYEVLVECVTTQYDVNVTLTGLAANNFISFANGGDTSIFTNNETQTISVLDDGTAYNVSIILTQPTSPNQVCSFTNTNSGSLNGTDVEVTVECVTTQYDVNINVTGLADTNTVSFANGADTLDMTANGVMTLSTLDDESAFDVSITAQPVMPDQECVFSSANSGNLAGEDLQIDVSCSTDQFTVGVIVSGLAPTNSVVLANNADEITISSNGAHNFPSLLDDDSMYSVSVVTQPVTPNQTCEITGTASGTIDGADVLGIQVDCVTNSYFIGGNVTGLLDGNYLVLQNNGTDDKTIMSNGSYVFSAPLLDEQSYEVTIDLDPNNPIQPCTLSNADSILAGEDVIDVNVDCLIGDDLIFRNGFEEVLIN